MESSYESWSQLVESWSRLVESLDSLILCYFENGHFQNRLHEIDSTTPRSKLSQQATPHYFAIGLYFDLVVKKQKKRNESIRLKKDGTFLTRTSFHTLAPNS